ncbi:MAG: DEAD/DEAH box helicase [Flavobacteriia bacterium]|nr:DEAD/DEAH box helicase [Flavobacteriia bacterium]OJX34814.1 MAG: hypothetical protein BGO87_08680 [Flavobacteriia bacterium 40-80]
MKHREQLILQAGFSGANNIQKLYWEAASAFSILLAPTGSGKTLAFLVRAEEAGAFPLLIISPTRELALQLVQNCRKILPERTVAACYGGHSVENEENQLKNNPQIVVATPGRLADHTERRTIVLKEFRQLIIDEYDKLLELGFRESTDAVIAASDWQNIQLSSATVLPDFDTKFRSFNWKTINLLDEQQPDIDFYQLFVEDDSEKAEMLLDFLIKFRNERVLVFCSHREACERISDRLHEAGIGSAIYHGGLRQSERERAFIKFNRQSERLLVCTDLAARGLDLPQVDIVIHYQPAKDEATTTHRNGRTGRSGKHGNAVYFTNADYQLSLPLADSLKPNETIHYPDNVTLFCKAGRKQKMRKSDFIGFLCKEIGIPGDAICGVDIFDDHSYVTMKRSVFKKNNSELRQFKLKKERLQFHVCY